MNFNTINKIVIEKDILNLIINELDTKALFNFTKINKFTNNLTNELCKQHINSVKIIQKCWRKYIINKPIPFAFTPMDHTGHTYFNTDLVKALNFSITFNTSENDDFNIVKIYGIDEL